jgi:DNA polymerase-3 subunit delta
MDALTFLKAPERGELQPVYVVSGDDDFLKRQTLRALRARILGPGDDSFGLSTYPGDKAEFAAVRGELETRPFLGERRLVVVDQADPFVTTYRSYLEKYLTHPAAAGVLVLEVKSFPATTNLAKSLPDGAKLVCKAPAPAALAAWCVQWAAEPHGKQLSKAAAQLLVEYVGNDMGLLDQELAKLAAYAGKAARIEADDVDLLVGHSQAANAFTIFDAIVGGRTGEALAVLDALFTKGESELRLAGAFVWQLRSVAQVARLSQMGVPLREALDQLEPNSRRSVEPMLRHLGLNRASRLFDALLELNLGLKGGSPLPSRTQLEALVVRLARPREAPSRSR